MTGSGEVLGTTSLRTWSLVIKRFGVREVEVVKR